jgi:hypothetical protein
VAIGPTFLDIPRDERLGLIGQSLKPKDADSKLLR